jgi:hypothetical protein
MTTKQRERHSVSLAMMELQTKVTVSSPAHHSVCVAVFNKSS